jgi:hypothetical protein
MHKPESRLIFPNAHRLSANVKKRVSSPAITKKRARVSGSTAFIKWRPVKRLRGLAQHKPKRKLARMRRRSFAKRREPRRANSSRFAMTSGVLKRPQKSVDLKTVESSGPRFGTKPLEQHNITYQKIIRLAKFETSMRPLALNSCILQPTQPQSWCSSHPFRWIARLHKSHRD